MKLNTKLMGLALTSLVYSTSALAAVQEVKPSQSTFNVPAGSNVEFDVIYTAESPHSVTGLGLQLYFDNSKLTLNSIENEFGIGKVGSVSESDDTTDGDNDTSTNRKIVAGWKDDDGTWASIITGYDSATNEAIKLLIEGEYKLYTVKFTANASTTINFTGDSAAEHTFAATPVTVTITTPDTKAPTITAPADVTAVATGPTTTVSLGTPTVTDEKDPSPVASNDAPAAGFPLGDTTVTWTATDASGNVSTPDTQKVTITDPGIPTLIAPAAVTAKSTGVTTAVNLVAPSVNDVIDGVIQATADNSGPFPLGDTTVTWTVKNSRGATSTATQKVTIVENTDTESPQVTAPADIVKEATGPTTPVNLGTATATDNEDGSLTPTADKTGPFAVGEHTVTWTATDTAGNPGTDTQKVTITDTTKPDSLIVPDSKTVTLQEGSTSVVVDLGNASAHDLAGGNIIPKWKATKLSTGTVVTGNAGETGEFTEGFWNILWTATDPSGNSVSLQRQLNVASANTKCDSDKSTCTPAFISDSRIEYKSFCKETGISELLGFTFGNSTSMVPDGKLNDLSEVLKSECSDSLDK